MVSTIPVVSRALPHVHGMSPEVLLNYYAYIAYGLCGRDEQCWKSRKPLMERGMPVQKNGTQKYELENLAKVQKRFNLKFGARPKISSSVHFNHWSCIWVCALLITMAMNHPFIWRYITIQPEGFCYERHKLGINRLGNIMKVMVDKSGLHGNKQSFCTQDLCDNSGHLPETQTIQLTGHCNIQLLHSYKRPSLM